MDRLSSFLLRRLRHVQRREIRRLAVRNGLLMMTTAIVDGHVVGRYVPAFDPSHLTGEVERDRQWVRDRLAAFLIDAPQDASGGPDLLSAGPVWPAQLRRRLVGNGADDDALAYAVRVVAEAGEALGIKTMATVLLLAAAMEESGVELRDLVAFVRQPAGVFAVQVSVEGFERALPHLVEETAFVPFGPYVGMAADFSFVDELWRYVEGRAKRVFLQIPVAQTYRPSRSSMRAQLLWALAHGSPVLAVAETHQGVPDQVDLTSDVRLTGGGISVTLLADLLAAVHGSDAALRHDGLIAVIDAGALTLDDLSIAIRPGRPILFSIDALAGLAVHNREERDNEKDKGDAASSRRLITQSPSERATQSSQDRSGKGDSASSSAGNRRSKAKPTGAEVIKPMPADGETPGKGRPPPLVETLTGYGAAKDWALGVKADLADYLAGELVWSDMSTKLLLSGPPGTGKTTFARAMCNSLQIPLVVTSVSTWLQGEYLNAVLDRMANTFAEARAQAPCILFIDEIDGIGTRVSASRQYADYWNACVNKLLELLDGAVKSEGVIVVGATNRPNEIDEAIRRSGRLETHIDIPRPDIPALAGILAHHLGADLDVVAKSDSQERGRP
ncbi:AAA family ATPase [Rhizobium ruizarguesonis]|uniref:AAA family ATPase n=1 Tax=Rhizobium ruizarguesonis TaxID=2081791 RepID=UPI00163B1484|nr:ATP-binding protein [Rhizobium ruizarguesonis]MBC2802411.1 AAA family ATPase [Rhizobium ruizarguesonis]